LLVLVLASCSTREGDAGPSGCTSRYEDVALASTRPKLDAKLISNVQLAVAQLRVQGSGTASGASHQPAEFVDLLDARGRRIVQVEVFQLDDAEWVPGQRVQRID
jgi:hypothetical protein